MDCPQCSALNPDDKNYCGDCGTYLHGSVEPFQDFLDARIKKQVEIILEEKYENKNVVEADVTDAIVQKLGGWVKLWTTLLGVPLAVIVIVLGVLGVSTFADFRERVSETRQAIDKEVIQFREQISSTLVIANKDLANAQEDLTKALEDLAKAQEDLAKAQEDLAKAQAEISSLQTAAESFQTVTAQQLGELVAATVAQQESLELLGGAIEEQSDITVPALPSSRFLSPFPVGSFGAPPP